MLRLLSSLTDWLNKILTSGSKPAPGSESGQPAESTPGQPFDLEETIQEAVVDRWLWLTERPWLIFFFLIVLAVVACSESFGAPWWIVGGQYVSDWIAGLWRRYPSTVILAAVALLLLLFGPEWYDMWRWARARWKLLTTIGVILILFAFSLTSSANEWYFSTVEVLPGSEGDLDSEALALQFRGNLNAIGLAPFDTVSLSAPNPPAFVTEARRFANREVDEGACPEILIGPASFEPVGNGAIILPRSSNVRSGQAADNQVSFETTVGTINLPLEGIVRSLLRLSPNYREFSAQVILANRSQEGDTIQLLVNDSQGKSWTVSGPRSDLPQLINFLAYRIALDDRADETTDAVQSADLALTLGNRAFAVRDYKSALAYYRLTESLRPGESTVLLMLGTTYYQLSLIAAEGEAPGLQRRALQAFERASILDPLNSDIFLHQACMYFALPDYRDRAAQKLEAYYLSRRRGEIPFIRERIAGLSKTPPLGPGVHLSTYLHPETGLFDLYYISGDTIHLIPDQSPQEALNMEGAKSRTLDNTPRQVFAAQDGVYFLTAEGLANFLKRDDPSLVLPVINDIHLDFANPATGKRMSINSLRQIYVEEPYLFAVSRFGRVLRFRLDRNEAGEPGAKLEAAVEMDARQIVLDTNDLYVLKEDGSIWRVADPQGSDLQTIRQLTDGQDNREIAAANNVVYMLRLNGTIWRYGDRFGAASSAIVHAGFRTNRLFASPQGLFVLKNNGQIIHITHPDDPAATAEIPLDLPLTNRVTLAYPGLGPMLVTLERDNARGLTLNLYEAIAQMATPALVAVATVTPPPPATPPPTSTPTQEMFPTVTSSPTPLPAETPSSTEPLPTVAVVAAEDTPEAILAFPQTETAMPVPAEPTATPAASLITADEANWFLMDRTEVTNAQYNRCLQAGACEPNTPGYNPAYYGDRYPAIGLNWSQASRYCQWAGGRLPTLFEWRIAASPDGRRYPWGDEPDPRTCDYAVTRACTPNGLREVGSAPLGVSPDGLLDMIGNVWEWTATPGSGKDDLYITLGGSWDNPDGSEKGGLINFNPDDPNNLLAQGQNHQRDNQGFRCVYPYVPTTTETP